MNNWYYSFPSIKVIIILTPFLLLGCGGKSEEKEVEVEKEDSFKSFQLDIRSDDTPFAELIDKLEITRFEETEESLLSYVRQVEIYEDKMFVPGKEGNIHVFSGDGDFIRNINRQGDGPEEYRFWKEIWLEGDTICLYVLRKGVWRYDFNGNFISSESFSFPATHIHPYKDGYALDMNYRMINDTSQYALVTLNKKLGVDQLLLPFTKRPEFGYSMPFKTVFPLGDEVLVFPIMKDTVYRLSGDSIQPAIHYNFGEDWFFKPGDVLTNSFMEEVREKGRVWWLYNTVGKRYVYLSATVGNGGRARYFINRENGQSVRLVNKLRSGEDFALTGIKWDGDDFLFTMQSAQLADLLEELDVAQYSYTKGSTLEEIESSENPVLVRIKVKDFAKD